jgi:hypothetical protein
LLEWDSAFELGHGPIPQAERAVEYRLDGDEHDRENRHGDEQFEKGERRMA